MKEAASAKEIVVSAHEAAHAVASVRLRLPFEYVTLDDPNIGPHVKHLENLPRPIAFYCDGGSCCDPNRPICNACRAEQERAESFIMVGFGVRQRAPRESISKRAPSSASARV